MSAGTGRQNIIILFCVLEITVSFLGIHNWELGFSHALLCSAVLYTLGWAQECNARWDIDTGKYTVHGTCRFEQYTINFRGGLQTGTET